MAEKDKGKRWVALCISPEMHFGVREWLTSRKRLTEEELYKLQRETDYEVDLTPYGYDFWMRSHFISSWISFEKKKDMEEAKKKGFDKCFTWDKLMALEEEEDE